MQIMTIVCIHFSISHLHSGHKCYALQVDPRLHSNLLDWPL